ncbi:MAG: hypothetical protein IPK04_07820 [Bdellovibrionales bacterium]|nr:hypothetical protein [Bdellovibrionales bacterium]
MGLKTEISTNKKSWISYRAQFRTSGNLPNVFLVLHKSHNYFPFYLSIGNWGPLTLRVGSCRRYFEKLAVVVAELDLGATMKYEMPNYLKFDFDST